MKIYINLDQVLEEKGITAYELAKESKIVYQTILNFKDMKGKGVFWETLDNLCEILDCEPGDLIKVRKDNKK